MTTDRDGNRSNPYKPNPSMCCEACAFGTGEHAEFCERVLLDVTKTSAVGPTEYVAPLTIHMPTGRTVRLHKHRTLQG